MDGFDRQWFYGVGVDKSFRRQHNVYIMLSRSSFTGETSFGFESLVPKFSASGKRIRVSLLLSSDNSQYVVIFIQLIDVYVESGVMLEGFPTIFLLIQRCFS